MAKQQFQTQMICKSNEENRRLRREEKNEFKRNYLLQELSRRLKSAKGAR